MGLPSRLRQLTRAVARQPPEDCSPPRRAVDGISLTPGTAAGTAAAAAAAAVAWSAPPLAGPYDEQLGPYPVGVASLQLNDHTRSDSESALGVRSLLTEVWFPADDVARSMPANQFSEFVLRGMVPGSIPLVEKELSSYGRELTIEQLDSEWHNVAVRDAPVRPSATPAQGYPLIVFSHGNSATRFGYTYLCEMLASHGYVVAAPDHTGNCRFTLLDGAYVPMGGPRNGSSDSPTGQSALDRPRDVSFVIDEMARLSAGGDSRWAGRIDCSKVGCSGGSFGGYTTMAAAEIDDRIAAIMPLVAGGPLPLGEKRKNTSTPAMVLVGALDAVVNNRLSKQYYDETDGPKYWVEMTAGGHMSVNCIDQYNPNAGNGIGRSLMRDGTEYTAPPPEESHAIVNAYMLSFFERHLKGAKENDAFLAKNHFGDAVVHACSPN